MLESALGDAFSDRFVINRSEAGFLFIEIGLVVLDFVVRHDVYFRKIFQVFMEHLRYLVIL